MRQVWKFPLRFGLDYTCVVEMPVGARAVRLAPQFTGSMAHGPREGVPTLWAVVDVAPDIPRESRTFGVFGTGHNLPDQAQHVGSYDADPFVWHVFDVTPREPDVPATPALGEGPRSHFVALWRDGFRLRGDRAWIAPDDEPLTTEQIIAVATLQERGYGAVVSA